MMFDLRGRTILRRYCDADPSAWQRAQGWAIAIGLALVSQSPSGPSLPNSVGAPS